MKKINAIIFFISTLLLLNACTIKPIELIKIESFKILNFSTKGAVVEVKARIKNNNNFGFTIKESNIQLYLDNNELGNVYFKDHVKIKANKEDTYTFVLQSDLAKLIGNGLLSSFSLLFKDKVTLQVKGKIKARAFLISNTQDIDFKETVSPKSLIGL